MTTSDMSPADIRACTCGDGVNGSSFGGDWSAWIIIFIIFAAFGWGGNGGFGGSGGGASQNYVLASDFATLQRQISDGVSSLERKGDAINNGLCDGFYAVNTSFGNLNTNLCQQFGNVTQAINQNGYENRLATQGIASQISSCCCDVQRQIERGFADTNYNLATQNCATLAAIDKVGDRIIGYMADNEMQKLRDENQTLRFTASQQAQNAYLISQLGTKCPEPAYIVQPPQQVTFPTNCCGNVTFSSNGCGCGSCG